VKLGGMNAIRQIRIDGAMEPEQAAHFPAPSDKPTLWVQWRDGCGTASPWIPAHIVWLDVDVKAAPGLLIHTNVVLSLEPPLAIPSPYPRSAMKTPAQIEAKRKLPSRAKGRPKPTRQQREERDAAICAARRCGATHDELATNFDLARSTIGKILRGLQPDREPRRKL
jgi:hypothetical protein